MWKSRLQTNPKTKGQTLSPFATQSPQKTSLASTTSTPSPRTQTQTKLPTGVRYVRQTPSSIYGSVPHKEQQSSPTKKLRFADPLMSVRKTDKTDNKLSPTPKRVSTLNEKEKIIRPVIIQQSVNNKKSPKSSSNLTSKTVALSPALKSSSPIFSTNVFSNNTNNCVKSLVNSTASSNNCVKSLANSIASSDNNKSTPNSSPLQTQTMIEIKTPEGSVKKSAVLVPNASDGVHRSSLSFQHPLESVNKTDPKSIAVNVNVAVGVDCNEKSLKDPNSNTNTINANINDNRMTEDLQNNNNDYFDAVDYSDGISSSLKVAVRLRPFLQSEMDSGNDIMVIDMKGNTVRVINSDNENYNKLEFGFDVCLNSSDRDLFDYADQDTVYRKMGEPLLDRSLEGYNVCLFAYGQTGSGKSHTMMGSEAIPGIIPRFANELYKRIICLNDVMINVEVSYLEIYNEKIYDLLSDYKNSNKKILRVREHPQTGPYVEDLTIHVVNTFEELMDLLFSGKRRRATASTAANDESSRSHSIFTIFLSQLKKSDDYLMDKSSSCTSKINLVDLAGSERVGICGTSGERLKEGTLINKSLLTLGKVISQLAENGINNKSVYVPYRDSVLTWLLKESLGGNSRTSMIATISPAKCHLEETLSTLRYAAIARRIVNFVRINEDPKAKKIRELMEEIAILKKQHISNANKLFSQNTIIPNKDQMTETCCQKIETFSKTTSTSFILRENQTQFDLLRTNILEEQQRSLLNEMRKQKQYSNIPNDIPQKSKSQLLKQIHDLFEDVLNKDTFESEETTDESTLIANTSDTSDTNALQSEESDWN